MKYVLIGNSAAAVACVEGIRQRDREGDITMVTNEPYHTYSRPLISYLLAGKTDRERMKYRPDDFYEKNRCELIAGVSADHLFCVLNSYQGRVILRAETRFREAAI